MKKELFIHFAFLFSFLAFVSVFKGWFDVSYLPFVIGGIIGTVLPDLDHFIYAYFLRPGELTSQRAVSMIQRRDIKRVLDLLADTRYERTKLIFHTAAFQIVFFVLAFFVITSSSSLLGRGIVLGFLLHQAVDQLVDLTGVSSLDTWFKDMPFSIGKDKHWAYWVGVVLLVFIFGFLL